ncbi:MAG: sensor histidine kinase, partial [Chloroflexota bacterium]
WTGTSNFAVVGLATALAPSLARPPSEQEGTRAPDLFSLALGTAAALTGASILIAPGQFANPIYDVIRSFLPLFGLAFLLSGLGLVSAEWRVDARAPAHYLAHLAAGGTLLAFFVASAVPLHALIGIAYYGGFGLALVLLPWLRPRLDAVNPASLQVRLSFALAVAASLPVMVAVGLVETLEARGVLGFVGEGTATREVLLVALLLTAGAAALIGVYVARWLAAPLHQLARAAGYLAAGDVVAPLPASEVAEVKYLATSFADMRNKVALQTAEREQLLAAEQEARETAERAVKVRDEFISIAAHELKTPVTSLQGFAQLLLRQSEATGTPDPAMVVKAMATIEQQSKRLSKLTEQLLNLSRLEAGRLTISPEETDLAALVADAVEEARHSHPRRSINLDVKRQVQATADPLRFWQVVTNLLDNAVKFSPADTPVEVTVDAEDGSATLVVRDHGPGIAPEKRERVFERFYQAHDERHYGGMGIGLYISQEIVYLHGGEIGVEAPADGGSRFVVRLPLNGRVETPPEGERE